MRHPVTASVPSASLDAPGRTPLRAVHLPLARQRALVLALQGAALLLLALHAYVRTLPATVGAIPTPEEAESAWWGLWPVTYVPGALFWSGAALLLLALAWALRQALHAEAEPPAVLPDAPPAAGRHSGTLLFGVSLLLALAFFAWPVAHTRWGDAYMISKGMAWPDPALRLTHSWQAPLDVFLHSRVWLALGPRLGWEDAAPVYRLLSPLAGLLYLAAAHGVARARERAPYRLPAWLPYGLLASLGLLQLFFGYVENYSFAAAGVLVYLWLVLRVLDGHSPLWLAAAVLAISHALHPSTIALAPSLVLLGLLCARREGRAGDDPGPPFGMKRATRAAAAVVLPMLIVGVSVFVWMELSGHGLNALFVTDRPGGGDGRWFVPLWATETRWEHFTFLSWLHLREVANEQLLVAPVVLPALLLTLALGGRAALRTAFTQGADPAAPVLAAAALLCLGFTVVWNPDYGGQRDWDLFSLAALPLALWTALLLGHLLTHRRLLWAAAGPLILLQALHTAAWVYSNTLPWEWPA